uniref:Uncharacterized protein n=1 Tax=Alexandrium catenella TaxID=2925 RepID=A0A7S1LK05_ALECA|mmetsp:Transcript_115105/g.306042  ORF Transcript_115105/g.306042 Transcript_115105/m.306042 type:complete len:156 (+) Transcript_115105:72-539(+)|eukprot:CAMPEP_0171176674 /NCGR_PEP_ID=MMETSP0790-20130122/11855_1 /TAXON_ID=2925 /ORGANISM="Alexandrium catenella, Strain OF101" /LENGTH=155 /DNA_ID=CAMNT_0011641567 /DNA_START=68 /DNA_END=535 /DNA_ORIENTATION=+
MPGVQAFHGCYGYGGGDVYSGELNIHGKPDGQGILYRFESGECDVGTFTPDLKMTGKGVRFGKERDEASEMDGGSVKGKIDVEKALEISGLASVPPPRSKGVVPTPTGYDALRHQKTKAWYQYRQLAELPLSDSAYGANPFPPTWKKDVDAMGEE